MDIVDTEAGFSYSAIYTTIWALIKNGQKNTKLLSFLFFSLSYTQSPMSLVYFNYKNIEYKPHLGVFPHNSRLCVRNKCV